MRARTIAEVGKKYGCLTFLKELGTVGNGDYHRVGLFRCDCGEEVEREIAELVKKTGEGKAVVCMNRGHRIEPTNHRARNSVYRSYQNNAKVHGRVFELTKEEFFAITTQNCFYCGKSPSNNVKPSGRLPNRALSYIHNGVDRWDSSKGYTIDNCVPCCAWCNWSKSNLTAKEFIESCKRVVREQSEKGGES